ncbi:PEP-utilizing enzyme [Nanoarchaeota archaeon]
MEMPPIGKFGKLKPMVTRKYVPLIGDFFMGSYADIENYQKLFFVDYYTRCGYLGGKFYYGDEAQKFGEVILVEEEKEEGFINKVFSTIYAFGEKLLTLSEEIRETDYSNKSMEELLNNFKEFSNMYKTFAISLMGFNIQFPVEEKLKKILECSKNPDEYLSILSSPRKDNFAALEQANLLKICIPVKQHDIKKFEDLPSEILERIKKHIYEFGWINARGGQAESWSEKELFERMTHIEDDPAQKLVESENHKIESQEKTELILKELKADKETIKLVDIAKELVYFRTYRTDYLNKIFFNITPILEAIAKKRGLTYQDMLHLRIDEIEDDKKIEKDEIERRINDYALITLEPNKLIFSSDPEEIKKLKDYCCEEFVISSEITGRTAFPGKVKGRAKIVIDKSDLGKVEKGDIMISPMTTPDFVLAMEKAAAFVTDEGGITCHAAIVAREMKKPCIIGTKTATQALKDGDLIELDADKGVVKKI